jgi:hypothetical protein
MVPLSVIVSPMCAWSGVALISIVIALVQGTAHQKRTAATIKRYAHLIRSPLMQHMLTVAE